MPAPARADVVVVGAGPAGAAAAATLAGAGRQVVVVDKARFPRDKICGDGLTTWALRQLERLDVDATALPSWRTVPSVVLVSPSGRRLPFPLPAGPGTYAGSARRLHLDDALVVAARRAGAVVHDGVAATGVDQDGDLVSVTLHDGRRLKAPFVVAADGMWSPTRRWLGVGPPHYRGDAHAFRQYFVDLDGPAADELTVWFEPDLVPGIVWSFPLAPAEPGAGPAANVGIGLHLDERWRTGAMGQLWREVLRRPTLRRALGPSAVAEGPVRAWPIPARVGRLPFDAGRVLFVGDAVAATDPLTGEGIGQALATGRWAAESILAGDTRRPGDVAAAYRRHTDDLVLDHRLSHALVAAMASPGRAEALLRLAGATGWTRRNFIRWLFEDYPRAVLATPRRWHRGMFSGPGVTLPHAGTALTP